MARIIGTYPTPAAAQQALDRLAQSGIPADCLSLIGRQPIRSSRWKKSLLWGGAAGAALTFVLPGGVHVLLAGHLARTLLSVAAKGLAGGVAAVGTVDLLRRAGLDRRSIKQTAAAIDAGRVAVAIKADWITTQRARAALIDDQQPPDPRLVALVRRHGYEYQSFLSLYGGMQFWLARGCEAAVVYRLVGRVAVVVAAPLAAREEWAEATREFLRYCDEQKLDCLMVPIGAEYAEVARACGLALLSIGESGYFELPAWKPAGDRAKKVRSGVNQARKAGVRVQQYDPINHPCPTTRAEIEVLCQRWVETREVDALGWLLELDPFALAEHKRYFIAREADGRLVGLLACSPIYAREGWYLEDLIRNVAAERGVSELLVVEALQALAAEGARLATLGTSPLAGIKLDGQFKRFSRLLQFVYEHFDAFYHFKTLHRFKAKFAPSYVEHEYLAFYPPRVRLRLVFSVMGAFDPAGFTGLAAAKLRKLWREARRRKGEQAE